MSSKLRRKTRASNAKECVEIIENAWCRHRDRQMFRLLKHAVCAAEHALSNDILRRLCPKEAELLKDPSLTVKVKFRFGGTEFPPVIYFKVFVRNYNGSLPKYVNGKKIIPSGSKAAYSACSMMGQRVFYQQMLVDSLHGADGKVADELEIVTMKDYMQYNSMLDELPAYLGGRANSWRRLNLEDIPRQSIFYDVVSYVSSGKVSSDLRQKLPTLMKHPTSESVQIQHVELLKQIKSLESNRSSPSLSFIKNAASQKPKPLQTSRRSRQALKNVSRMRQAYISTRSESLPTTLILAYEKQVEAMTGAVVHPTRQDGRLTPTLTTLDDDGNKFDQQDEDDDELENDFNDQADALYAWTEGLSWNDDYFKTPRIPTA